MIDGTSAGPELVGDQPIESSGLVQWFVCMAQLETRRPEDPALNPGPGQNFSLKLVTYL